MFIHDFYLNLDIFKDCLGILVVVCSGVIKGENTMGKPLKNATKTNVVGKGIRYSDHDVFKSVSTRSDLTNVGTVIFNNMKKPYVDKDGIITDNKGYYTMLYGLRDDGLRPPMDSRTGGDYSEEMNNIKEEVRKLTTDPKTGKKRVFLGDDDIEYVFMNQWRDKKKLQSYSKKDKKPK